MRNNIIPPPIPPANHQRVDARKRAELKAEEQAKRQADQNQKIQHTTHEDIKSKNTLNSVGKKPQEHGGPSGLEPTRYGDWEKAGRCIDF